MSTECITDFFRPCGNGFVLGVRKLLRKRENALRMYKERMMIYEEPVTNNTAESTARESDNLATEPGV